MAAGSDMHVECLSEWRAPESRPVRLLDRLREAIRYRHYSYRTEQVHVEWIRRHVLIHGKRHPDIVKPRLSYERLMKIG
jgi:hypothetical protein